jgi:hypothetical protein
MALRGPPESQRAFQSPAGTRERTPVPPDDVGQRGSICAARDYYPDFRRTYEESDLHRLIVLAFSWAHLRRCDRMDV